MNYGTLVFDHNFDKHGYKRAECFFDRICYKLSTLDKCDLE